MRARAFGPQQAANDLGGGLLFALLGGVVVGYASSSGWIAPEMGELVVTAVFAAAIMAGEAASADPAYLAQLRQQFGFDQPLWVQLWLYVKGILQLDLGFSYRNNLPVLDLIAERLPATSQVVLTNRSTPPDFIIMKADELSGGQPFQRIEDLISQEELRAISENYKQIAGFALKA